MLSRWKDQTLGMLQNDDRVGQRQTLGFGDKGLGSSNHMCDENMNAKAGGAGL